MNKISRSLTALALAAAMSASSLSALAYEPTVAQSRADTLYALELFRGTENGYELEKPLTRMEALIMLIRLSGKELDALYGTTEYTSPFTDAPTWEDADKYLAYAYSTGLAKGVTATAFDPESRADAQMYITFLLRALGYTDSESGTVWDNWNTLAASAGLLDEPSLELDNLLRGDAVLLSRAALDATVVGSEMTLLEKLNEDGAVSPLALSVALAAEGREVTADSALEDIMGALYVGADTVPVAGLATMPIEADMQSFFIGATPEQLEIEEGLVCEPMMTSQAHSVALVRVKDGTDVEEAKKLIRENVNPRKWICVGVSEGNVRVESIGNLILLVMDNNDPDTLVNNFTAMDPSRVFVTPDENGMMKFGETYVEAGEAVNTASVERYIEKVNTLNLDYFPNNEVYLATIPEKSYFVRESTHDYLNHAAIHSMIEEAFFDMTVLDLSTVLSLDDYLNTDRHLRQEKLFPLVNALGEAMGFTVDESAFTAHTVESFIGDYKSDVSDISAETLTYLTSTDTDSAVVDNYQNKSFTGVYEVEKLDSKIPYDIFLSGATPLTVIKNPNATEQKRLIIFRDSFGSNIAPLLIGAYSEITLIDLRYMASSLLPKFVDFTDAQVLFLFSDAVVNNSTLLK